MDHLKDYVKRLEVQYEMPNGDVVKSNINSLDVNEHILSLCSILEKNSEEEEIKGHFEIYYFGFWMFAGDGPSYSRKSIKAMAELEASIGQDIYCNCDEDKNENA